MVVFCTVAFKSPADVNALEAEQEHISYVVANGAEVGEAVRLASALRARYPRLRAQHPDGLCYAASDRPAQTPKWSDSVTGGPRVHRIADSADIQAAWLAQADTVGLVAATPEQSLAEAVIEALSG